VPLGISVEGTEREGGRKRECVSEREIGRESLEPRLSAPLGVRV